MRTGSGYRGSKALLLLLTSVRTPAASVICSRKLSKPTPCPIRCRRSVVLKDICTPDNTSLSVMMSSLLLRPFYGAQSNIEWFGENTGHPHIRDTWNAQPRRCRTHSAQKDAGHNLWDTHIRDTRTNTDAGGTHTNNRKLKNCLE